MKQLSFLALALCTLQAFSADRIVEEFGTAPTYPNIAAAVTAAADGDRIIIKNRAGDIPWIENIAVNKSLEFLAYQDNGFFVVQGNWTIAVLDGRAVSIVGMSNTSGSILTTGTSAVVGGTRVRVMGSRFLVGNINLGVDAVHADVVGNELQAGFVRVNIGNVVGNQISLMGTAECIRVTPTTATFQGDTCAIIGNWVSNTGGTYEGIYVSGRAQVYHIRNNWVRHSWMGIHVQGGNVQAIANLVQNNSIEANVIGNGFRYGVNIANSAANSVWEIMNNAIGTLYLGTNRGINYDSGNSGQVNVYYNHMRPNMTMNTGFTYEGNNTLDQPVSFNADGTLNNAPAAVNGGNPAAPFYDLDLSVGDAGAYGGSYTLSNFFPLHTGAARVYMTGHPFNLRSGATLRVRANAWDR